MRGCVVRGRLVVRVGLELGWGHHLPTPPSPTLTLTLGTRHKWLSYASKGDGGV